MEGGNSGSQSIFGTAFICILLCPKAAPLIVGVAVFLMCCLSDTDGWSSIGLALLGVFVTTLIVSGC